MSGKQIIGIVLIRNEDIYIERVIRNILNFCDKILVADNLSTDKTAQVVKMLAEKESKIEYRRILSPGASQKMIEQYIDTDTWIFGVDGDEIYDPAGLKKFRAEIFSGKYDKWWTVFGNVLNCATVDLDKKAAEGYMAPPSRSMTKLYNFSAISAWAGPCVERLHGGSVVYKEGYSEKSRLNLHLDIPWEKSPLRCLHLCFLRRSSKDPKKVFERENIVEISSMRLFKKVGRMLFGPKTLKNVGGYKKIKYMRGDLMTVDISPFLQ